jgi:signal transduction histidine kinase/ActR/RegA family two-component response regulator
MRNIQNANDIQFLYVVRLAGERGWYFIYDADEEAPVELGFFEPHNESYPEFNQQVLTGTVDPVISETQWGWLLSVYEPVFTSRGELVGYVGADFSMDGIVAERRAYLLELLAITLLITAALAVVYILVIRKTIILPVNTMVKAVDGYLLTPSDGSSAADEAVPSSIGVLDIHTNDELESLAEAMKNMDRKINLTIIELRKAEKDAHTASRTKTAFLAQMSHELRTPMNAIMGMARSVLYEADDKEKVIQALKQILTSSQHLLTILNDILDISNIESGKLTLTRDVFSMADVCRSLNDLVRLQCQAKGLSFLPDTYKVTDTVVWGDRVRLMQAVGSLLNNAVKFTGKGGEVRFAAELEEETERTAKIRFTIRDTGIGLSPEQQTRLFQAFAPVDKEINITYGGVGAKLSICQSIVEMMGGSITVDSTIGKGSVFSFTINFDKAEAKEEEKLRKPSLPAAVEQPSTANFLGKKILVVDDVMTNRAVVKIALKGTGVDVIEAKDGLEALEKVTSLEDEIDLILMDVSMPNMDGYEATRAIRALDTGWAKTIPIIALTAHTYKEDVNAALEAGMDYHLGKPVNFDILLSTVTRYLTKGQMEYTQG